METDEAHYRESLERNKAMRAWIPGGVNSVFRGASEPCPLTFVRGFGAQLVDVDGNEYVDYALGMGTHLLGHAPPVVTRAVAAALEDGQLFAGQHPRESELAELMMKRIPCAEMIRFGLSGSEMTHLAIRLARGRTGRQRFIRFYGHYHGWMDPVFINPSSGALDGAGEPILTDGQSIAGGADVIALAWNDPEALDRAFGEHRTEIAAVILEPIMCNTGVILPRPGYLEKLQNLCRTHGVVLIFDEVITGFRVDPEGAQGLLGLTPDLAVFSKAIGSGFPIAAIAGSSDLMDQLAEGRVVHGGTYNTGIAETAAAIATVRSLIEDDPYPQLERTGRQLMQGLEAAAVAHGVDLAIEGFPAVFHTRFGPEPSPTDHTTFRRLSDEGLRSRFVRSLQDEGVRVTSRGTWFVSTAHTDRDVELTLRAADHVLRRLG